MKQMAEVGMLISKASRSRIGHEVRPTSETSQIIFIFHQPACCQLFTALLDVNSPFLCLSKLYFTSAASTYQRVLASRASGAPLVPSTEAQIRTTNTGEILHRSTTFVVAVKTRWTFRLKTMSAIPIHLQNQKRLHPPLLRANEGP